MAPQCSLILLESSSLFTMRYILFLMHYFILQSRNSDPVFDDETPRSTMRPRSWLTVTELVNDATGTQAQASPIGEFQLCHVTEAALKAGAFLAEINSLP